MQLDSAEISALAIPTPERPAMPRFDAIVRRVSERANAVLVKEVRTAVRSTYFRVSFLISLVLCTVASIIVIGLVRPMMADNGLAAGGTTLFAVVFACACLGAVALVPFSAFSAMSAEADENALEFLLLSNMSPVAIVLGKLFASLIQSILILAIALPFACLAWSMGGLSPWAVVSGMCSALGMSLVLCSCGIALSTVSRTRWVRIVLMVLFGFFLFNTVQWMLVVVIGTVAATTVGATGSSVGSFGATVLGVLGMLPVAAIAIALACGQLSHREESRSTGLRRVTTTIAAAGACVTVLTAWFDDTSTAMYVGLIPTLVLLAFPLAIVCTEGERLPLGPRARPPARGWRGGFGAMHLSGGGRGALLATFLIGGVCGVYAIACVVRKGHWFDDPTQGLMLGLYTWIYLLLPSVFFSLWSERLVMRILSRATIWFFPWIAFLGCTMIAVVFGAARNEAFDNPANPVFMYSAMNKADGMPTQSVAWGVLFVVAFFTLALNLWRMARGWSDVRRAMKERDARPALGPAAAAQLESA